MRKKCDVFVGIGMIKIKIFDGIGFYDKRIINWKFIMLKEVGWGFGSVNESEDNIRC